MTSISNPYFRILRPNSKGSYFNDDHVIDQRYCIDRQSLIHAYHIIQNDLKIILDYVELHDENLPTFSHKIYELLLRTCTEFENNCKGILLSNGFPNSGRLNITDYFKINAASKLNEFEIRINVWSPSCFIYKPFQDWSLNYSPLGWYNDYNSVKHDRSLNFGKANLENLIKSIGGLFVIIVSQFGVQAFNPYQNTLTWSSDDDGFLSTANNLLSVKFPDSWPIHDRVDFKWEDIKNDSNPFQQYSF